jgi:hypothetical protein
VGNLGQPNQVYANTGSSLALAWPSPETDNTQSVAWGDWDGDGDLDLAVGNLGQPNRVYANSGGSLALAWPSPETDNTESVAWGDWDGDGDLDLVVGNSRRTVTFIVRHPSQPQVSAPEFNTPFTIAGAGGTGWDAHSSDNSAVVTIGVPDLVVVDFTFEPNSLRANVPVTFTVVLRNQGTGRALNPDLQGRPAGSTVDIFIAPVPSYPWERYSEKDMWAYDRPLPPGEQETLVIKHFGSTGEPITFTEQEIGEIQAFCVRADSHHLYPYGLVPESDEWNNVECIDPWSYYIYLPMALKRSDR